MTLDQITQCKSFDEVRPEKGQVFIRFTVPVVNEDRERKVTCMVTAPSVKGNILIEESSVTFIDAETNKEITEVPNSLSPRHGLNKTIEALIYPVIEEEKAVQDKPSEGESDLVNTIKGNLDSAAKIVGDTMVIYAEGLPQSLREGIFLYLHQRILHHTQNARKRIASR